MFINIGVQSLADFGEAEQASLFNTEWFQYISPVHYKTASSLVLQNQNILCSLKLKLIAWSQQIQHEISTAQKPTEVMQNHNGAINWLLGGDCEHYDG